MSRERRSPHRRAAVPAPPGPRQPFSERTHTHLGLTLVELVVVLVILVALGGLLVPQFGSLGNDSREQATRTTLANIAQAIVGSGGYAQAMRYASDASGDPIGRATGLPWPGPDELGGAGLSRADARQNHPQLHYLFRAPISDASTNPPIPLDYDPTTRIGWNGPWLDVTRATTYAVDSEHGFTSTYGLDGDLAPFDAYGNDSLPIRPIVIQMPNVTVPGLSAKEQLALAVRHTRVVSAGPDGMLDTPIDVLTPTLAQKGDDLVLYLYREDPNP